MKLGWSRQLWNFQVYEKKHQYIIVTKAFESTQLTDWSTQESVSVISNYNFRKTQILLQLFLLEFSCTYLIFPPNRSALQESPFFALQGTEDSSVSPT